MYRIFFININLFLVIHCDISYALVAIGSDRHLRYPYQRVSSGEVRSKLLPSTPELNGVVYMLKIIGLRTEPLGTVHNIDNEKHSDRHTNVRHTSFFFISFTFSILLIV